VSEPEGVPTPEPTNAEILRAVLGLKTEIANLAIRVSTQTSHVQQLEIEQHDTRGAVQALQGELTRSTATTRKQIVQSCGIVEEKIDTVIADVGDVSKWLRRLNEIVAGLRLLAKDAFDKGTTNAERFEKLSAAFYRFALHGEPPEEVIQDDRREAASDRPAGR
jgi:outer membrane murein-binding lipoprotein Lpp